MNVKMKLSDSTKILRKCKNLRKSMLYFVDKITKYKLHFKFNTYRWISKKVTTAKNLMHCATINHQNAKKAHNNTWEKTILKQTITKRRKSVKRNKRKPKISLNNQKVIKYLILKSWLKS